MRILSKAPDGGKGSGVTGYFLVECKSLFSIVLLRFSKGTREAFHEHAFNAVTVWLWGAVKETYAHDPDDYRIFGIGDVKRTPRACFHKIDAFTTTWALSFRGPWVDRWREKRGERVITLTHGRKELT